MCAEENWLAAWASLAVPELQGPPDWSAVGRIIAVAANLLVEDHQALSLRLESSRRSLAPLDDPLAADLGLHRWLANSREENYSDWLEFAIQQLATPELVYGLFQLAPPRDLAVQEPKILRREYPVQQGDPGRSGRLDLIVRYEGSCPLVVEVKTTSAEEAYTAKDVGYAYSVGECVKVLLVTESRVNVSAGGFLVRLWSDVARRLRRAAPGLCHNGRTVVAAMLLAFAGAIEQNLCGFPAHPLRLLEHGVVINSERLIAHLDGVFQA